jgi:hypothetical protein
MKNARACQKKIISNPQVMNPKPRLSRSNGGARNSLWWGGTKIIKNEKIIFLFSLYTMFLLYIKI